jgi:hypothetical protein
MSAAYPGSAGACTSGAGGLADAAGNRGGWLWADAPADANTLSETTSDIRYWVLMGDSI